MRNSYAIEVKNVRLWDESGEDVRLVVGRGGVSFWYALVRRESVVAVGWRSRR